MDRRTKFEQNLSPLYLPKYQALCKLLPNHWQPYQGYRTFKQQDALYAQGRTAPGHAVTNAKGGQSAHNYGCATDWTIWDVHDEPIWLEKSDPAWNEYIEAVKKCGLKPGAAFGDIDHNEIDLKCSWSVVAQVLDQGTQDDVQTFIRRMMV